MTGFDMLSLIKSIRPDLISADAFAKVKQGIISKPSLVLAMSK
jgi:hypothetical protein